MKFIFKCSNWYIKGERSVEWDIDLNTIWTLWFIEHWFTANCKMISKKWYFTPVRVDIIFIHKCYTIFIDMLPLAVPLQFL